MTLSFSIVYIEPPFHVQLINSSPRVGQNQMFVDFVPSKPIVQAKCYLSGEGEKDCKLYAALHKAALSLCCTCLLLTWTYVGSSGHLYKQFVHFREVK